MHIYIYIYMHICIWAAANRPHPLPLNGHGPHPPCGVGGWVGGWSLECSFSIFLVTLPIATIRFKWRMCVLSRTYSDHYDYFEFS